MGNFINNIANVASFGLVDDITGSEAAQDALSNASAKSSKALQQGATQSNDFLGQMYGNATSYLDPFRMNGMSGYNQYLTNLGLSPPQTNYGNINGNNPQFTANMAPQYMGYGQQAPQYSNFGHAAPIYGGPSQQAPGYSGYNQKIPEYSGYDQQIPEYSGYDVPDPGMFDAGNYSTYGFQDPGSFEFDESQVSLDPGMAFRRQQGEQSLSRQLSAMGMGSSGAAVKQAMRFNQGLASDEYGKAYARQYGQQADEYQSDLGAYGREYGRAQDMYNTDVQSWQRGAAKNLQDYQGSVDQWERGAAKNLQDYQGSVDQWERGAAQNLQNYMGKADAWDRGAANNWQKFLGDTNTWQLNAAQNLQDYKGATDAWDRGYNANLQDFGVQYGQWNDQMNRLAGITDMGFTTSGSLADLAMMYGSAYGNNLMTGAGAQATNLMNQGNIGANAATSGWNALMDLGGLGASLYGGYQTGNLASALSGGV